MKKYIIWMTTEYKRAASKLPLAVKRAVILAMGIIAVACMIAFCTLKIIDSSDSKITLLRVGYVADDDMITNLALSYVEDMESVKSICSLEKIDNENEGLKKLENGELSALVVLPPNVIGEIISGTNTHGKLYLPKKENDTGSGIGNVAVLLFEELEKAGMGMLGIAQAEIYATSTLVGQVMDIDSMYDDIDRFNLSLVTQREKLFSYKRLSVTENDTYAVYYAGALLTIYLLIAGLFLGEYLKRGQIEQVFAKRRMGIGYSYQLICKYAAGLLIMIAVTALPIAVLYVLPISINLSLDGIIAVLMATIFMTVFAVLVYELSENRQAAVVMIGFNAIIQAYMSGCIVPSTLLPVKIVKIGEYLPAAYIKKAFRIFITGRKGDLGQMVKGLFVWSLIVFIVTILVVKSKERIQPKSEVIIKHIARKKYHIPTLSVVILRRFMHKKSIWICLIVITIVSILIVRTEKTSDTSISVAFYDESGEYTKILEEYEGLVTFVSYENEDDVKRAVLKDEVECGYIIPQDITDNMIEQMSNGMVTVYQDDDTVAVPIINEVIYERIFKNVSLKWYESYIFQIDNSAANAARQVFEEKLNAKITFDIDIKNIGTDIADNNVESKTYATFPVWSVVILIVAICGIYGIIQVAADIGKKKFYRCKKISIYLMTILIPLMVGVITGIIILTIIINMGQYSY